MSAIFINSSQPHCGIYQYGLRIHTNIKNRLQIDYAEVGTLDEYLAAVKDRKKVLINYYHSLFRFLDKSNQAEDKEYYYIYHESFMYDVRDGVKLNNDPTRVDGIPRPLAYNDVTSYPPTNLENPVIGSFGFGFLNKEFDKVVELVQSQFDTATIRLLMPEAYWVGSHAGESRQLAERCRSKITKPGIQLWICHDFLSNDALFTFLRANDLNIFLYDKFPGRGCSSVIDSAIGVNRPFAISDSDMFRHIYDDQICAYKTSLRDIMQNGTGITAKYRDLWSADALAAAIQTRLALPYV